MKVLRLFLSILPLTFLLVPAVRAQGTIEHSTMIVNYCGRIGTTNLDLRSTLFLPNAQGKVEVRRNRDLFEIEAKTENMVPANVFGAEYLTYVLWAIPPDG